MTDIAYMGLPQGELGVILGIHERDGGLRPDAVVESAADPTSPLHGHFEWDDTEAGQKYRLGQARDLIRRAMVYIRQDPGTRWHAFVNIGVQNDRAYQLTAQVTSSDLAVAQVRRSIIRDLERVQDKLRRFDEFAAALRSVNEAVAALG